MGNDVGRVPTRRDMLKGATAGAMLAGLGGCTPSSGGGGGPNLPPWRITNHAAYLEVSGYVDRPSLNRGEDVTLHLNCVGADAGGPVQVSVWRMGWHGGAGAQSYRPTETVTAPGVQAATTVVDVDTKRCEADWAPVLTVTTADLNGPWPSGLYVFHLTAASGKQAYVPFTVRDDASTASVLVVNNHLTWWAYNQAGGYSLYNGGIEVGPKRPFKDDPVRLSQGAGEFFWLEYRLVRWLERNNVDVTFVADFDLDREPVPASTEVVLFGGHAEYWTGAMRNHIEEAMATRGVGLVVFGANTSYWRGRLEGGSATSPGYYVLWKTPTGEVNPLDPLASDPDLASMLYRRIPGQAEQYLLGGGFRGWVDANAYVPGSSTNSLGLRFVDVSHPVFSGTGINPGQVFPGLCGGEIDWWFPEFGPNPTTVVCETPLDFVFSSYHQIGGYIYQQSSIHEKSYPGGQTARVFNAGTYTWVWGLDDFSFENYAFHFSNPQIQQLTTNILDWARKRI